MPTSLPPRPPTPEPGLLTADEHAVMEITADLWNGLCRIAGRGKTREADLTEACAHVHAIQHMILAQAAARAYPEHYRLLGESLRPVTQEAPRRGMILD